MQVLEVELKKYRLNGHSRCYHPYTTGTGSGTGHRDRSDRDRSDRDRSQGQVTGTGTGHILLIYHHEYTVAV